MYILSPEMGYVKEFLDLYYLSHIKIKNKINETKNEGNDQILMLGH